MSGRLPAFRLVRDHVSRETVQALEQMLEQARSGQLIGIAFCAMYRQRRYVANTAGEAARSPTFALGMIQALEHKLCKVITKQCK